MKLLISLYANYKKSKLLEWMNYMLRFTDDPCKRLKLLKVRQKVINLNKTTLAIIKHYENKVLELN